MKFKEWFLTEADKKIAISGYGSDGTLIVQIGDKQYTYTIGPYEAKNIYELAKTYRTNKKKFSHELAQSLTWKLFNNKVKKGAAVLDRPPEKSHTELEQK